MLKMSVLEIQYPNNSQVSFESYRLTVVTLAFQFARVETVPALATLTQS